MSGGEGMTWVFILGNQEISWTHPRTVGEFCFGSFKPLYIFRRHPPTKNIFSLYLFNLSLRVFPGSSSFPLPAPLYEAVSEHNHLQHSRAGGHLTASSSAQQVKLAQECSLTGGVLLKSQPLLNFSPRQSLFFCQKWLFLVGKLYQFYTYPWSFTQWVVRVPICHKCHLVFLAISGVPKVALRVAK